MTKYNESNMAPGICENPQLYPFKHWSTKGEKYNKCDWLETDLKNIFWKINLMSRNVQTNNLDIPNIQGEICK